MITPEQILLGAVVPGLVSFALILGGWRAWTRREMPRWRWVAPAAMTIAFLVGFVGLTTKHRPPAFPPRDGADWSFHLALLAGGLAVVSAALRLPVWARAVLAAGFSGLSAYLLVARLPRVFSSPEAPMLIAVAAGMMTVWIVASEIFAARAKGLHAAIVLSIVSMGASIVLMTIGSPTQGLRAGAMTAAVCAIVPLAWWARGSSLAYAAFVLTAVLGVLLVTGRFYNRPNPPVLHFALLMLTPVLLAVSTLPVFSRTTWRRIGSSAVALLPLLIGSALSVLAFVESMNRQSGSMYPR